MQQVQRQSARHECQLRTNAQSAWDAARDWGNLDWWGCGLSGPGTTLGQVVLEEQSAQSLPARLIRVGAEPPVEIRETLLASDADCYRLYFRTSDGFLPGIKNYVASWAFSPTEDGGCTMLIESMFDVIAQGDGTQTKETVEMMYTLISEGLDNYLSPR